ncbi:hypothetical protein L6164_008978 [Bauhinia variegata]|uniref:Uncharacterized protein n=1 Tax=Bauhinia variegata TaxID=167791 RepID=A0ACB9PNY2_BAUVA|nr:hypothetical protein L6164_008978 [Bauhinia variegata]
MKWKEVSILKACEEKHHQADNGASLNDEEEIAGLSRFSSPGQGELISCPHLESHSGAKTWPISVTAEKLRS